MGAHAGLVGTVVEREVDYEEHVGRVDDALGEEHRRLAIFAAEPVGDVVTRLLGEGGRLGGDGFDGRRLVRQSGRRGGRGRCGRRYGGGGDGVPATDGEQRKGG